MCGTLSVCTYWEGTTVSSTTFARGKHGVTRGRDLRSRSSQQTVSARVPAVYSSTQRPAAPCRCVFTRRSVLRRDTDAHRAGIHTFPAALTFVHRLAGPRYTPTTTLLPGLSAWRLCPALCVPGTACRATSLPQRRTLVLQILLFRPVCA